MAAMTVPHDPDIELELIGSCMNTPSVVADVERIADSSDFYVPSHAETYAAIVGMWRDGQPIDPRTIARRLAGRGLSDADMVSAIAHARPQSVAVRYAETVAELHARRRLLTAASELVAAVQRGDDLGAVIDAHSAAVDEVSIPTAALPATLTTLAELMNRPREARARWIVPGLLRSDWRVVLVGGPGTGKTQVFQSIGVAASQGRHPFVPDVRIPPVRVLFVDLENSEDRIIDGGRLVHDALVRAGSVDWDDDRLWVWREQDGIDVRSRRDLGRLEAVLNAVGPDLVCMGPVYKMTLRRSNEGWDEVAATMMASLDGLRTRHKFALLMEDHGTHNELRPMGSSLWTRWPELGLTITLNDKSNKIRDIGRFRLDRLPNAWPDQLHHGESFPWVGYWAKGTPSFAEEAPAPPADLWEGVAF